MVGFFCIGLPFSVSPFQTIAVSALIVYILGSFAFVLSVYSFNAWAGYPKDQQNPRLQGILQVSRSFHLSLSLSLLCLVLGLYYYTLPILPLLALPTWCLWAMYSSGKPRLVRRPFVGTFIHFVAQLVHFQLAYQALGSFDKTSVLISVYFSLLFSAGHFYHEVIDYAADHSSGKVTGAVSFGMRLILRLSDIFFTLAILYWFVLWQLGFIHTYQFSPFAVAYGLQVLTYVAMFRGRFTGSRTFSYQTAYRVYYLLAGVAVMLFAFAGCSWVL